MKKNKLTTSTIEELNSSKNAGEAFLHINDNASSNQNILNETWDEIKSPIEKNISKNDKDLHDIVIANRVWKLIENTPAAKSGAITKEEIVFLVKNQDKPTEQIFHEYQEKQKEEEDKIRYSFDNNEKLMKLTPEQRKEVVNQISSELDVAEEMTEEYLKTKLK